MASKVPDSPANADSAKARVFDMGPLGVLIAVEVPDEAPDGKTGPNPPHFVFIVDRSSSMDKYAGRIVNLAIPTALEQLGCPPDMPVTIITFDSQTSASTSPAVIQSSAILPLSTPVVAAAPRWPVSSR